MRSQVLCHTIQLLHKQFMLAMLRNLTHFLVIIEWCLLWSLSVSLIIRNIVPIVLMNKINGVDMRTIGNEISYTDYLD